MTNVEKAFQYVEQVLDGIIPSCRWVKLACQRHKNDMERAEDPESRWVFDPAKAERPCRVVEQLPHTKGKWAKDAKLIHLEPWEAFIICSVFGWVDRKTGLRRFREVTILVPRKNGKSILSAGVGLYMLAFDNEAGAEIYCNATTEKQAWEVFTPAKMMVARTPQLQAAKGIQVNASNINVLSTGSKFQPVIGKPGDGSSPSMAIIDEYHEHATSDAHDTMITGMGAREQPLLWVITTAGDNLAGPCYAKQLALQDILTGTVQDDRTWGIVYTIDDDDDWTDPACLIKANPNYGVSVDAEFLMDRQQKAIISPRDQGSFKTKHLNLWVNSRAAYFNTQSWINCPPAPPIDTLKGRRCYVALDLASKVDIAAMEILFPLDIKGHFARYGKIYLPRATVEDPKNKHYQQWQAEDILDVTDGNVIDFERIEDDVKQLARDFRVVDCCFDPYQGNYLSTRLMAKGINMIEYSNAVSTMSDPMKTLDSWIIDGKLHHNCGPAHPMTWMMSNVVSMTDRKDNVFPCKEREDKKIDGPVSLIMCVGRAMMDDGDLTSVYENRGLIVF